MKETMLDDLANAIFPLLRTQRSEHQARLLLHFITSLKSNMRKQLVTLCRSMSIPVAGTTLYVKTSTILSEIHNNKNISPFLPSLIISPIHCGLVLALCISMPLPSQDVREIFSVQLAKEMLVMETSPLPTTINYNCFFGEYATSIHPTVPPNPRQAHAIHMLIEEWVVSLEKKPYILPHITNKLCSKATQEVVKSRYPGYLTFEEEGATQADLEYLYMMEGDLLEGCPCEIKQRWYTSGLVPRTYYAAGSDAYHRSKYMRNALNSLCDFLPPTERFARVNPQRILLSSNNAHALIYDLTSFTSNMHEQRHFIGRLALYCMGRIIRILDSVEGVVEVDLGILLQEYNELNIQPKYSSRKLLGSDLVLSHHTAGFLGVYGNLASCTFLHGAVMSQLVSSFSQIGIAGDDGLVESSDDWMTFFVIRLLGLMEESKGYTSADVGWQVYLKRPVKQFLNRIYAESFALYSMIEHMFNSDDNRFFPIQRSVFERKKSLASSVVSYLRSLSRLALSDEHVDLIHTFLAGIYQRAGFPLSGYLPQLSSHRLENDQKIPQTLIPSIWKEAIGKDPMEYTVKSLYDGVAVIPQRIEERIELDKDLCFAGCSFEATGSGLLSYLRKLGFVELEQSDEVVTGEAGLELLTKHLTSSTRHPLYTVNVLKDIPSHLLP